MQAYIHGFAERKNGTKDSFFTVKVEVKEKSLWWQDLGLMYTATGYGPKIPSRYMVKFNNKWRRVYVRIWSNSGTAYIEHKSDGVKSRFIVDIDN
jgi:hypothetical protein